MVKQLSNTFTVTACDAEFIKNGEYYDINEGIDVRLTATFPTFAECLQFISDNKTEDDAPDFVDTFYQCRKSWTEQNAAFTHWEIVDNSIDPELTYDDC
jgi:hypothetical protein